ncbi:unnamed protein product [Pleuronectes platessa]|uniref:peptidylprolyl isomerase n=1 Tax=Pleuronectes platessa TaxID=8262 RepID=A0A9N7Y6Q8_PLEPL|nr:unnamed protein product [Pleuronectes platessa]
MRVLVLFAVTLLSLCPAAVSGADKKKLQIGIKKRVDNCPIKSRKGDVLNMHYTGKLEDGTEFDSSIPRDRPFTFTLGTGQHREEIRPVMKRRKRRGRFNTFQEVLQHTVEIIRPLMKTTRQIWKKSRHHRPLFNGCTNNALSY